MVCFRYIIVNTLYISDNTYNYDDDDDDNNNMLYPKGDGGLGT